MENSLDDVREVWPTEKWANAAIEDLNQWRVEALRRQEKAERQREDAHRLAEIYDEAAAQLTAKSEAMREEAERLRADGDEAKAIERIKEADSLKFLAEQNTGLAEEKNRLANSEEQAAAHEKSKAMALSVQVRRKAQPWEDWEL